MTKLPKLPVAVTTILAITFVVASLAETKGAWKTTDLASIAGSLALAQDEVDDEKPASNDEAAKPTEPPKEDKPDEEGADPNRAARVAEATEVLEQARKRMVDHASIKANIVESVAIGRRKFKVTGSYLQGSGLKLRLDFTAQVGNSSGTLLEVCDGEVLWTRHKIVKDQQITRRNVRDILNAVANSPNLREDMLVAELSLGGLPGLLASVQRTWEFSKITEESIGDKKFTVIEGGWKKKYHDALPKVNEDGVLPDYIPDRLRLYFDNEFNFPHRILYLKRPFQKKFYRPMVTIDFTEIVLNDPVSEDDFYFLPPDEVTPIDITKQFVERLSRPQNTAADPTGTKPSVKANQPPGIQLKDKTEK